ncbi:MAG: NUDIX hydrolase [Rhizobiaceae bacterium]|nr:NUDIX hydrolase [Rhizobiaceae bacterium]
MERLRLRPRDAATLIIVDESGTIPKILLGRRSAQLVFMPGKLVFPGGRVEADDLALAAGYRLSDVILERLLMQTTSRFGERHAAAAGLAAIRETFEEAGLMIGNAAPFATRREGWRRFAEASVAPDPAALVPLARAITPPGPPRRYDTRFFGVSAERIAFRLPFEERPDLEFDQLGWFSLDALSALELPGITRQVLSDIDVRLRDGSWRDPSIAMPFYRARNGRIIRDMI